jgi:hypothetical protein
MEVTMSELLQLAKLAKDAYARREASWVHGIGTRNGHYTLSLYDAIEHSLEELQLGESFRVPAQLLLHWPNDSLEWADKLIARFEADENIGTVIAKLNHERGEPNGKPLDK